MKWAVPIAIGTCPSCGRSYTWAESRALPIIDTGPELSRRTCAGCGDRVQVREDLEPATLWRSWEDHQRAFPDSPRRPVAIPETLADRVELWWRKHRALIILVAALVVLAVIVLGLAGCTAPRRASSACWALYDDERGAAQTLPLGERELAEHEAAAAFARCAP
jgi:hypothetical protein